MVTTSPTLNSGAGKQDTGKTDLQAQVDYFDEFANTGEGDDPLPVDYSQRAVGVTFPESAPATYEPRRRRHLRRLVVLDDRPG